MARAFFECLDALTMLVEPVEVFGEATLDAIEIFGVFAERDLQVTHIVIDATEMCRNEIESPGDPLVTFA
jgi:hypothetical protein